MSRDPLRAGMAALRAGCGNGRALAGLGFAAVPFYVAEPLIAPGRFVRFVPVLEGQMLDGASLEAAYARRRHLAGKVWAWFEVQPVR